MLALARVIVALATTGLLVGGYFVSQTRYMTYRETGDTATMMDYLMRLDESPIPGLALVLILAAVILCCIPDQSEVKPA